VTTPLHSPKRRNRRADKRQRLLQRMAAMRAAKERRRMASAPPEREPRFVRATGLSLGVRDDCSMVVAWTPLVSVRDASRRLSVILREYQPATEFCLLNSHF
jgi:hypothetical protein